MALPPRYQRHRYLRFEGFEYTDANITDLEERLGRIYGREIRRVYVFDFRGLTELMDEGLSGRMLMEHRDAQGHDVFTSRAWRRLFEIRSPLVHELILEFFSTFRYLSLFASGRKRMAMISRGQFVARLAEHFRLLTKERLYGLTICEELDDTWDWVASGLERQQVAVTGSLMVAEDALVVDEGASAVLAPLQAPQAPHAAGPVRAMVQMLGRLDEDVHVLRGALGEQREVLDSIARDFSRFTIWTVIGLSRMMDQAGSGPRCKEIDKVGEVSII
ncbi:hypothetical protein Tco_0381127 [Tanacetum coccineum]